jgi:hypothetical protein
MVIALGPGQLSQFIGDFGEAWVEAVCLAGGFIPQRQDRDRRGFDFTVADDASELVRVQVKSTENPDFDAGNLKIDLDVPSYNLLREGTTKGILVGVALHHAYPNWIRQGARRALVRVEGFWIDLHGKPPTTNTSTITIRIPLLNMFQPDTVARLFL